VTRTQVVTQLSGQDIKEPIRKPIPMNYRLPAIQKRPHAARYARSARSARFARFALFEWFNGEKTSPSLAIECRMRARKPNLFASLTGRDRLNGASSV
jgi:hypothetical protein